VIVTEYFPSPETGTTALIQRVKQDTPETYVIVITNTSINSPDYENLFTAGLDDVIVKPYPPEKVLVHIWKGLRHRELILKKKELEARVSLEAIVQPGQRFKESFRQELKRARRHQHPLSILILQISGGEWTGNRLADLFVELGKILRKYIREEDIIGRDDGNVGILLPETGRAESQALLQRIFNLIRSHPVFKPDTLGLSIQSFTYPEAGPLPESLRHVLEEVDHEGSLH
jgi:PleD family two-component response regulator